MKFKKYISVFILCVCLFSCEYFDKKKISSEEILQEDLRTFNWSEVDEYPSFPNCETSETKELRKQCFETTLVDHIVMSLQSKKMVVTKDLNDTIMIKFHISEKGEIQVLDMTISDETQDQIPDIRSYLLESVSTLPTIDAAIKRRQFVKTEFVLPVVLKSE